MSRAFRWVFFALVLGITPFLSLPVGAQKEIDEPKSDPPVAIRDERIGMTVAKGQLLVTLHQEVKESELNSIFELLEAKFKIVDRYPVLNQFLLATDHDRLPELRHRLENHPYVAAVSYNGLLSLARVPNDPVFRKPADALEADDNWNLYRIKAPEAWDITQGGAAVAVIDSGAQLDHEELVGRTISPFSFATNSSEMQSGMKKIKYGKDRFGNQEVRDHGTHVAITIGGKSDNGLGTSGIAPQSPLLPLQALYYQPFPGEDAGDILGWNSSVSKAITRALDAGAPVINMSLGGVNQEKLARWRSEKSPQLKQQLADDLINDANRQLRELGPILDRANEAGAILVVAAGNFDHPAEFGVYALSQRCIIVAATTREDKRCDFMNSMDANQPKWGSNYGPFTTVSAPGHKIWSGSSVPGRLYKFSEGTSMACPHVAGVVALMKTLDPELKHADVADILVKTGRPLDTDQPIGPLVNAKAALEEVRIRLGQRQPRRPPPPPVIRPPARNPTPPTLPPDAIEILRQPDPWNNPDIQRIIRVWFSFANPRLPAGGDAGGTWIFNTFGQVINVRTVVTIQQPIWFEFRFRFFWENALLLESTNMGTLYEFIVGTLRQGRFNPAPPRQRVPEQFRPRDTDPRPRVGGLPFDPRLGGSRWTGRNLRGETLDFDFQKNFVAITRLTVTTRYSVRINTALSPAVIDFYPQDDTAPILGLIELTDPGEMLIRTDFNNKRPLTVSRSDQATFVLKRTDIAIARAGANDDGVQTPILHRGTEILLRNLDPLKPFDPKKVFNASPDDPQLSMHAVSGDGQRLWLLVRTPAADPKNVRWDLWSMRTDGTDAKQHPFKVPENTTYLYRGLYSSHDGGIAWLHISHKQPFSNDNHAYLQSIPLSGAARFVLDTHAVKGVTHVPELRVTADGRAAVLATNLGLMRVGDDGRHHSIIAKEDVKYKDVTMDGIFGSLNISADGTHWSALTVMHAYRGPGKSYSVAVKGTGKNVQIHEELHGIDRVSMSDDGKQVVIQSGAQAHKLKLLLWREGAPKPYPAEVGWSNGAVLSGSGQVRYGVAGGSFAYLEDFMTGRRRSLVTGLLPLAAPDTVSVSRDGNVVSAHVPTVDLSPNGVFLFHNGSAPTPHHPKIKSVRQRYDGGKLVITVEAESADKLGHVVLFPLWNNYIPPSLVYPPSAATGFLPPPQNALGGVAVGADGHRFVPDAKRPGIFQTTVDMTKGHAYLDDTFSFRVIVTNADRTRATFQDVAVLK